MALSVEFRKNEAAGTLSWCHPSRSLTVNLSGHEVLSGNEMYLL